MNVGFQWNCVPQIFSKYTGWSDDSLGNRSGGHIRDYFRIFGIPWHGMCWLTRKTCIETQIEFLDQVEEVRMRGQGIDRESLPHPWEDVAYFFQKYITYERWFTVVYNFHFILLCHLHRGGSLNKPDYLLQFLKVMVDTTHHSKSLDSCVKHHRLIKLLMIRDL